MTISTVLRHKETGLFLSYSSGGYVWPELRNDWKHVNRIPAKRAVSIESVQEYLKGYSLSDMEVAIDGGKTRIPFRWSDYELVKVEKVERLLTNTKK